MRVFVAIVLLATSTALTRSAALRNLDFEEAVTNNVEFFSDLGGRVYGIGVIDEMLPGWQVFQGTNAVTSIWFNGPVGEDGGISVSLNDDRRGGFPGVREGKFDLLVGGTLRPLTLRQTGEIPLDAGYLVFNQAPFMFTPYVNGERLPDASTDFTHRYFYFIAPYAGQTVDLAFAIGSPGSFSSAFIDDIRFLPIPEPSTVGLLALGSLLWGGHIRRGRQKRRSSLPHT